MTTNTKMLGLFSAPAANAAAGTMLGQNTAAATDQTAVTATVTTGTPFLSAFLKMLFGQAQASVEPDPKKEHIVEQDGNAKKAEKKVNKTPEDRAAESVRALAFLANAKTTPQTEELRNALLQCDAQLNVIVPGTPAQQLSYVVSDPEDGNTTAKRPGDHTNAHTIELDTALPVPASDTAQPVTAAQALVAALFSGQPVAPAPVNDGVVPLVTAEARPVNNAANLRQRASLSFSLQQTIAQTPAPMSRPTVISPEIPAAGIERDEDVTPPVHAPVVRQEAAETVPVRPSGPQRIAPDAMPAARNDLRRDPSEAAPRPSIDDLPRGGVRIPANINPEASTVKAERPVTQDIVLPLTPASILQLVQEKDPEPVQQTPIPEAAAAATRQVRPVRVEKSPEQRNPRSFSEQLKDAQKLPQTEDGRVQIVEARTEQNSDDTPGRPQEQQTSQHAALPVEQSAVRPTEKNEFQRSMNDITGISSVPAADHTSAVGPLKSVVPDMDHSTVQSMLEQLSKGVSVAVKEDRSEMKLILHPEALGEVTVRVRVSEGRVSTAMDVQQVQVKQTIEANLPQLRESLTSKGLTMDHIEITTSQQSLADEASRQRQGSERRKGRQEFELAAEEDEAVKLFGYNTVEYTM